MSSAMEELAMSIKFFRFECRNGAASIFHDIVAWQVVQAAKQSQLSQFASIWVRDGDRVAVNLAETGRSQAASLRCAIL